MCGIAGFHSLDGERVARAGRLGDHLLYGIVDRGRDATGVLTVDRNGETLLQRRAVGAYTFVKDRKLYPDPRTVLLHTRFATTGRRKSPKDAHPQVHGRAAAIHNGTIANADELFAAFGLKRNAQVDTEIIPALVDYAGWDQAEQALSLMRGGAATAIVHFDHPGEVLLARVRSYPLVVAKQGQLVLWASTEHAIRDAWKYTYDEVFNGAVVHLKPGEGFRLSDVMTSTVVPGVYGVETERTWIPKYRPSAKPTAAPGVSVTVSFDSERNAIGKAASGKGKAGKGGRRQPRRSRFDGKARKELMAEHARTGGTNTTAEIDRLLAQLEKVTRERDQLASKLFETELERDLLVQEFGGDWEEADTDFVSL